MGGQRIAQRRSCQLVGAGDPHRGHCDAGAVRVVAGADDGGDHPIGGADRRRVVDKEFVLVNRGAVGRFALHEDQSNRIGRQRNAEHDVHLALPGRGD
ncbi:hypothetical protein A5693_07990 [Mycobacterium sp. E1319]|nr:hypothetical protein A5693_07990 [Mycobacterium sp. E1319]